MTIQPSTTAVDPSALIEQAASVIRATASYANQGLEGAVNAVCECSQKLNDLQAELAHLTSEYAQVAEQLTDYENEQLQALQDQINAAVPGAKDDGGYAINALGKQYSTLQTQCSNSSQVYQSLVQNSQQATSSAGNMVQGMYQIATSINGIPALLAQLLSH